MPEAVVSAAAMRIVKLLVGSPPQSIAQLTQAADVTRTAVTEQLNELVAAGFVEKTTERLPGRGRPRNLYTTTSAALLLLFASNENLVVPAIWQAIKEIGGADLTKRVIERVSLALADHYRRKITGRSPAERLRQMAELLRSEGVVAEVHEKNGRLIMHKRSCPFISMFEDTRTVCAVDEQMLKRVVDHPVRKIACRHDGDPCCSFELTGGGKKEATSAGRR